jgi:hypothetical protein
MGHAVKRIQEDEIKNGLDASGADLFLWTRTWPGFVTLEDLARLRSLNTPSVSYHLDLYIGISREADMDKDPFWKTDYVFTPDGDPHSAEVFKQKGINHHWLPAGVFEPECVEGNFQEEFKSDIAFIGTMLGYHKEWPHREELYHFLRNCFPGQVKFYGQHPYPNVRNQDLNDVFASTKIIIGDSLLLPGHTHYWSDRIYETTGRGGFIIHPYVSGLSGEFTHGKDIIFYDIKSWGQLAGFIDFYLEHDDEREKIRQAGHLRTKREHTYTQRLESMLWTISQS